MIAQEDGGIEAILEHFALQQCNFAFDCKFRSVSSLKWPNLVISHRLRQWVRNFAPTPRPGAKVAIDKE